MHGDFLQVSVNATLNSILYEAVPLYVRNGVCVQRCVCVDSCMYTFMENWASLQNEQYDSSVSTYDINHGTSMEFPWEFYAWTIMRINFAY